MARRAQVVLGLAVLVAFALASSSTSQGAPGAKPPDFDKAAAALEKHGDNWLDKPGVVGVGIGVNKAGKAVIHVYKVSDDDEGIPSDVDGVAVAQVRSGRFDPRAAPTDRWPRPVPIGVSSGLADFATGTLGARVTDGTNVYALSNNHVFAGVNTASIGDPITQPGPDDGGSDPGDRIATLADYQAIDFNGGDNTMDAAIALTSAGDVGTATPPDGYGAPSTTPTAASIGMGVQKYGRTTGLQLGTVEDISLMVDVCYFPFGEFCFPGYEARFVNQISVSPGTFSAPGDSGSLMVTQGGNQPVALLFAGDGNLTIGNPIIPVLQRFNATIEGGPPVNGPPTAPTNLRATAGDSLVELTWNAPTFDGGSSVTHYRVFRGPSPGNESFLALSTSPFHTDATAENGTTYYYKVSAVNANGEGPLSNGASATPVALVTPAAPLTVLDDFNRANENPLSDQGRWSNSIVAGENGHNVTSNQLACSVTTTCTAWRNNAQYGPDVEVYARLSTLPGVNNQLRLYARLQLPGQNGYLMWANQQSGTDEVWLDRFSGGAGFRLLTIPQELTAGDIMLLRVHGTSIEAWRQPSGGSWSRLGVVQDATHGAAGYVGVGLRGTTGRVDDFGARGLGGPPPDTTPPSAPGTLSAATVSSTRIELTWGPATDDAAVAGYLIERCEGVSCGTFSQIATTTTATSYSDTGLNPSTSYTYRVRAEDTATPIHNLGPYSNLDSATTQAPPDTEPPSAPGILSANAVSSTQIDLSWEAASDNVAVTSYRIERCQGAGCSGPDFTEIATTTGLGFQNTGLTPSTSYSYRVRAEDAATNTGPYSNVASQSTPAPPDTEPPGAPGPLTASAVSSTRIDLSWGAASDNVGVSLYRIERCTGVGCSGPDFTEIATTTGLGFQNTGLTPSTSYSYRVRAEDASTNTGAYSNVASQSTLSSIAPPVEPLPVLDGFNRTNENPLSDSGLWANGVAGPSETGLRVASNALACTKNSTCSAWRGTTQYGPDVEVYARVAALPGRNHEVRLLARVQQPGSSAYDGYMLRATQRNGTDEVRLERVDNGAITGLVTMPRELAAGDVLLLRVVGSRLEAWTLRGAAWSLLGGVDDSTYATAGSVAAGMSGKTCRLDDFGAR